MLDHSILARAQQNGKITINIHDLRQWTEDKRKTIDDKPFGGGPGMLMMVEPIYKALKAINAYPRTGNSPHVVLTAAAGNQWNQQSAQKYATEYDRVVIICGHYEGVDHRISEHLIDEEVSIGNYVLTGGELAAGVMIDSISRLIPGVLGNAESLAEESHNTLSGKSETEKEYPQYTRPAEFKTDEGETWPVPDILLSGNHGEIQHWKDNHGR